MFRRFAALPGALLTVAVLVALWVPLLDLHGCAIAAWLHDSRPFRDVWTTFAPHLWERSGLLALVTSFFAALLGVPCGWLLSRGPRRLRTPMSIVAAMPLGLPPVLLAAPFFSLTGPSRNALWACAGVLGLSFFPVVAFLVAAALNAFPPEEEEAALGFASPFWAWGGVLGRRMWPVVGAACGVVAALALWEMGAPTLLGYSTLSSEVYRQLDTGGEGSALPGYRAALAGLPLPLAALALLWPLGAARFSSGTARRGEGFARLPALSWLGLAVLGAAPIGILARFIWALDGWSALRTTLAANSDVIANTILLASVASLGCTFGAAVLCWTWRDWPRMRAGVWLLGVLPGAFAPVVIGVALGEWFNRDAFAFLYDSTYGMALWGDFARFFPVALALMLPVVLSLDAELLWAARGLGASSSRTFWTIALPSLRPALVGVAALLWALCAGELTVAVLVHGPGSDTLPIPIFNSLHAGIGADVAALCLVLAALCGGAMAVASVFGRTGKRR